MPLTLFFLNLSFSTLLNTLQLPNDGDLWSLMSAVRGLL